MKIAILDDYQGLALSLADWGRLNAEVTVFRDTVAGDALRARLMPFDVLCLMRERSALDADLIAKLPRLRLIVTTGVRNRSIDVAAAAARGIPVCGTDSRTVATSHATMMLILAAARGLWPEARSMRDGGWQVGLGRDLDGLTLGLVGVGRMGAAVAALARPFGVNLLGWSQNLTEARAAEAGVTRAASLPDLLARADIVSLHLVLSARTRGLIGAAELAAMKPGAVLVNTSRGPIVEWRALLEGLHAGQPAAAALDVYDDEPLAPDHPLRDAALIDAGRLLLTPHIGYVSRQGYEMFYRQTVEAIAGWAAGTLVRVIAP